MANDSIFCAHEAVRSSARYPRIASNFGTLPFIFSCSQTLLRAARLPLGAGEVNAIGLRSPCNAIASPCPPTVAAALIVSSYAEYSVNDTDEQIAKKKRTITIYKKLLSRILIKFYVKIIILLIKK